MSLGNLLFGAVLALLFVAPLLVYRAGALPYLARHGAGLMAHLIAALPAVIGLGIGGWFLGIYLLDWPPIDMPVLVTSLVVLSVFGGAVAAFVVRIAPAPRDPARSPLVTLARHLDRAAAALQEEDHGTALSALRDAASHRPAAAGPLVDAIRGELPGAETRDLSSLAEVVIRLRDAEGRLWRHETRRARAWIAVASVVAFSGFAVPPSINAISSLRACIEVEGQLSDDPHADAAPVLSLTAAIVADIEPGAVMLVSQTVDLDAAAASRHDPNSRRHLVEAGFRGGVVREWEAADGRRIHADVFEFVDPKGALRFQTEVNRYACSFANEAFGPPRQGIGLQVRWNTGDPIEEQVSWVSGSRRYVVSVGHQAPPTDHARILAIAERAGLHIDP